MKRARRDCRLRTISPRGVRFIAGFEGFRAEPYNDAAGHATVGFGHLLHLGPVTVRDRKVWGAISRERGLRLLRLDCRKAEDAVRGLRVPMTQGEFDATVSLVFNLGPGVLDRRRTFGAAIRRRRYGLASNALLLYVFAGGVRLAGLVRRRRAERRMFRTS